MIEISSLRRWAVTAFLLAATAMCSRPAIAGADLGGTVNAIQVAADGTLWFSISPSAGTPNPATYCKPGWAGLNMFIPPSNSQYAYYYGMLMTSLSKGTVAYVANVSVFNGSVPCDITQTGYGLVLFK